MVLYLIRVARKLRAHRIASFVAVGMLLAVSLLGNASCFYFFDRQVDPSISVGDALWYSLISITTIGYGDFSAQTTGARIGTIVFIALLGLTTFSGFFGLVIDALSVRATRALKGLGVAVAKDHVLIVNFPSENRVRQLIEELRADPAHPGGEIVVISDRIEELPFAMEDVIFVRGSPHDEDTYVRAKAAEARMAVVLSLDYSDPNSDAVVAAAVSIIDSIKSDIHIVAECLDERHRPLFRSVRCDAIVSGLRIASNLLVQEVHDPGVSRMVELITSNRVGSSVHSTKIEGAYDTSYASIAARLLEHEINVLAVDRDHESHVTFAGISPQKGDRLLYVAEQPVSWAEIEKLTAAS